MPEIDGLQFVKIIRGDPETAETPMIILSAFSQSDEIFAGLAAGADQYLTKPITPTELIAAIRHALQLTRQDRLQRLRQIAEDEERP